MSHDVGAKLRKLYALSTLTPEQEKDEARMNEARNAAYLFLKTARQNGVRVQIVRPAAEDAREAPAPAPSPRPHAPQATDDNPWANPHLRRWYERRRRAGM